MEHDHDTRPTNGNDVIHTTASAGTGQRHIFSKGGDDVLHMSFEQIDRFSHGHHVRGDRTDQLARDGADTFNFMTLNNVRDVVVGRIEDFDASRDIIQINGVALDLTELPANVRIVKYNGQHNDADDSPQQWLLIETEMGGKVFYALEGARIDRTANGGSNEGQQENHFIHQVEDLPDFDLLEDVTFVDQINVVPKGAVADGGVVINDVDAFLFATGEDQRALLIEIEGSDRGDLIAAGLNDDTVRAGDGNDQVWGGSGHDTLFGEDGDDMLYGGTGNDQLNGGAGHEMLEGGAGDDALIGGAGKDTLNAGAGNDMLGGGFGKDTLEGGAGNDRLFGRLGADRLIGGDGDDKINGGKQNDKLTGGAGADRFIFTDTFGKDVVTDFEVGLDLIVLDGPAQIIQKARATVLATDNGKVVLVGIDASDLTSDDFIFG